MSRLNVFVSSAIEELRNERQKIKDVLTPLGFDVFLFELDAGARSESTRQVYTEEVLSCDIYIGLFKNRFSPPTKEEYDLASRNNKEILIYISGKGDEKREPELESLLNIIEAKHTRQKYCAIQQLQYQVKVNVMDILKRKFKQASKQEIAIQDWLKLLQNKIDLYTSSTEFGNGSKDCWKSGHFRNEDVKRGYDARRPITDEIIASVDNNIGTIVFGRPYYGKSVILKRVMIEEISRGYTVLCCNEVGVKSNLLTELLTSISTNKNISKVLLIVDDVHRKGSEEFFKCLNNISAKNIANVRLLFAARFEELNKSLKFLNRDEAAEIDVALKKNMYQIKIAFSQIDAELFIKKAAEVLENNNFINKEKTIAKDFYEIAKADPLIFAFILTYTITEKAGFNHTMNFLQRDFNEKKRILNEQLDLMKPALYCSFLGTFGLNPSATILSPCEIYTHQLKSLTQEGFLFKNDEFRIRHELWALEFLVYLCSEDCDNDLTSFDAKYNVSEIIRCIINNLGISSLIGILNICSLWYDDEPHKSLGKVIIKNFIVPMHLDLKDKSDLYCFGLATFYSMIGQYEDSITYYNTAIEIDPSHVAAWNNKGNVYDQLGMHEEALTCYDKAIELEPEPRKAYLFYNKGSVLNNLKRYPEAIIFFDMAIELEHTDSMAWLNKGNAYHSLKNTDLALICVNKAIDYDSTNIRAWLNKGNVLLQSKKYDKAIECYNKAIEINCKEVAAWWYKGKTYHDLRNYDKAIECYNKAIEIDSKYAVTWADKGITLAELKKYNESLQCFDRAIELDSKNAIAWTNKGNILNQLGNYNESISCHHIAIGICPKYAIAWYNNGLVLTQLEKYEEAIVWFDRAIELDANQSLAWTHKGICLYRTNNHVHALQCFDRAIELDANQSLAWAHKGTILLESRKIHVTLKLSWIM